MISIMDPVVPWPLSSVYVGSCPPPLLFFKSHAFESLLNKASYSVPYFASSLAANEKHLLSHHLLPPWCPGAPVCATQTIPLPFVSPRSSHNKFFPFSSFAFCTALLKPRSSRNGGFSRKMKTRCCSKLKSSSSNVKSKRHRNLDSMSFISAYANCLPIQFLGPTLNGWNTSL